MKKKIVSMLLAVFLLLGTVGCGSDSPEGTITAYNDAIRVLDFEKAQTYIVKESDIESTLEKNSYIADDMLPTFAEWIKTLEYKIADVTIEGDKATVTVEYTHTDASDVFKAVLADYFAQALRSALTGTNEEDQTPLLISLFSEKAKTVETRRMKTTVVYSCIKSSGEWKIESVPTEFITVLSSNVLSVIHEMVDSFKSAFSTDKETVEKEASNATPAPTNTPTPKPTPTPQPTATPVPDDVLYSPADEEDFRMEIFDTKWKKSSEEDNELSVSYSGNDHFGEIIISSISNGNNADMTQLRNTFDKIHEIYSNAFASITEANDVNNCKVVDCQGLSTYGFGILNDIECGYQLVAWNKDSRTYYVFAIANRAFFDATQSQLKMMLNTFQNVDEYNKNGEVKFADTIVRGGSYHVPYKNATYYKDSIGNVWVQTIIEVYNSGTIPFYISGGSEEIEDANGKLIKTESMLSAYPDIILPGETALIVESSTLDEEPATRELNVVEHLTVKEAKNPCIRYAVKDVEIKDTRFGGLQAIGRVQNTSIKEEQYFYVVINLYDADGNAIGQLTDIVMETVKPGETIGFTASALGAPPSLTKDKVAYYEAFAYPKQYQF
ncbi:MAG: DUF4878 domain-containing protein [Clostridia bacterium]|nr:DUF4878 domain-containing protein [Clostridia bacterium]